MAKPSWTLKLDRAEKHLKEFEDDIAKYALRHPYRLEPIPKPKKYEDFWWYRLRVTEQPDPATAVILGDVIHNMRSSLDHLRTGLVPPIRRNHLHYFPTEAEDIWAKNEAGDYIVADDERRCRYLSAVKGMNERAKAIIEGAQPYHAGAKAKAHPFALLNSLDNADKHRRLTVLTTGVADITMTVTVRGHVFQKTFVGWAKDGAPFRPFRLDPKPTEPEMDVEIIGTPKVAVDVGLDRPAEVGKAFGHILQMCRECVAALEPFVE
jgi:hypothetical protein